MSDERSIRWSDTTRTHLGYVTNLILGLAIGLLAFCGNLLSDKDFRLDGCAKCLFLATMVVLLLSALLGISSTVSRLKDFRLTSEIVRKKSQKDAADDQLEPLRIRSRYLGKVTWVFFWLQLAVFALGVSLFLVSFFCIYHDKLF